MRTIVLAVLTALAACGEPATTAPDAPTPTPLSLGIATCWR